MRKESIKIHRMLSKIGIDGNDVDVERKKKLKKKKTRETKGRTRKIAT